MTRVKSLRFGSRRNEAGYAHRTHRSPKNRVMLKRSKFADRLKKENRALKEKKANRKILKKHRLLITRFA